MITTGKRQTQTHKKKQFSAIFVIVVHPLLANKATLGIRLGICLTMELFSRRRWKLVYAQSSNKFSYCSFVYSPLLFCHLINVVGYHLGQYMPSSPTTKELHGWTV